MLSLYSSVHLQREVALCDPPSVQLSVLQYPIMSQLEKASSSYLVDLAQDRKRGNRNLGRDHQSHAIMHCHRIISREKATPDTPGGPKYEQEQKARVLTAIAQPICHFKYSIRPLHPLQHFFPSSPSSCMQHDKGSLCAQDQVGSRKLFYRRNAARPMAAAIPGMAVGIAPSALDELEDADDPLADDVPLPVAPESADDAAELAVVDAPLRAELAVDSAAEAFDEALTPAPFPEMVVEPTVVVKVEDPEVSTETIGDVAIAEEDPEPPEV